MIVFVDATGVGQPIVVLLREPIEGSRLLAVYLTHDDLVAALGLAVQVDEPVRQVRLTGGRPPDPGRARRR